MRRIISALLICFSSWALAQNSQPLELAPDAPDRHIVVRGDTLWGIAGMFLKDPFRWPEIWRLNTEEIKNPHWIYPGQVVILDRSQNPPQLKLGKLVKAEPRIYVDDQKQAIPAIPQNVIEPFLSQPLVLETDTLAEAARIVAFQGKRISIGTGDIAYVTKVRTEAPLWHIFRQGKPMLNPSPTDPDKAEVLGYEATYVGTARQIKAGEPATFEVTSTKQEVGTSDYLLPAPRTEIISYVPHAPATPVNGRIIRIYGGIGEGGKFSIVSMSRGKKDGLEVGHVLATYIAGKEIGVLVNDRKEMHKLPDERNGLVFVFRVFDRVSYGLIMSAPRPVVEGDVVKNP